MAEKLVLFFSLLLLPTLTPALSYCGEPCQTQDDCRRPLICRKGKCTDDPYARPTICPGSILAPPSQRGPLPPSPRRRPPPPPAVSCNQSGTVICGNTTYPTYNCAPPITNDTPPILTYRNFSKGGASECDEKIHENMEFVVALSTGWYAGGSRCGRMIRISANGRTTTAKVVDECDSRNGCDMEHDFQPPCGNNVIAASDAVWHALGLNPDVNQLDITWSMV